MSLLSVKLPTIYSSCGSSGLSLTQLSAMSCGHCVGVINKALLTLDPAAKVDIDLAAKLVKVESKEDRASILEALSEAGYPAS